MAEKSNKKKSAYNKGTETLLTVLSIFPFFNTVTLFHMNGKVKNKKWSAWGWIILFVNILLMVSIIVSTSLRYTEIAQVPDGPQLEDYLGYDYSDKYTSDEYTKLPGYYEWEKANDEFLKSPEYTVPTEKNERFHAAMRGVTYGTLVASVIANLVTFFYVLSQKQGYIKQLSRSNSMSRLREINRNENTAPITQAQTQVPQQQPQMQNTANYAETANSQQNYAYASVNTQENYVNQNENYQNNSPLDLNTASEEQIASLYGLNVIDAKKAVGYRTQNGGFSSVDEFFNVIAAKPHIIARLQDSLTVSAMQQNEAPSNSNNSRRTIDI